MQIQWSKHIPITPSPTQRVFTMLPHLDALFGGSAGGGKSFILLANAIQHSHVPGCAALILRRTFTELRQPGALLDIAHQWFKGKKGIRYSAEDHTYEFETRWPKGCTFNWEPPPFKLQFGYLGDYGVEQRYQGAQYVFVGVDEAGHFETDTAPTYLFSRMRKPVCPKHQLKENAEGEMEPNYIKTCPICQMYEGLPLRFRMTANPGGPGHGWIKQRYKIEKKILKNADGSIKVSWAGKDPERPFIPSTLRDNKFLDQKSYKQSLANLDEIRRQQLEHGDWDISPDSRFNSRHAKFYTSRGEYFQLGPYVHHMDDLEEVFITVDPAASTREGMIDKAVNPKGGPSWTVISVWGLTKDYQLIWMHMKRFRQEIPFLIEQVKDSYRRFKAAYVAVETNGLGIGPAQILASQGVVMRDNRKTKDKIQNAANAIYRMKAGRVWLPEESPWLKTCMDELFTWTGHPGLPDDIVDTLSDACNIVTDKGRGIDPLMQIEDGFATSMPESSPVIGTYPATHFPGQMDTTDSLITGEDLYDPNYYNSF